MEEERKVPPPKGSGPSGRKLWRSIAGGLELDPHESLVLLQAVRAVDRLDAMAAELENAPLTVKNGKGDEIVHPLLVESRQTSLMLTRLIASLRLPSGLQEDESDLDADRPQRRGAARGTYNLRRVQ